MNEDQLISKISELIDDLLFDYDRLSYSGQHTYDNLAFYFTLFTKLRDQGGNKSGTERTVY